MGRPIPDADPVAEARMKFELENLKRPGFISRSIISPFSDRPDTWAAAKSGNPQADAFRPGMPQDVPEAARGTPESGVSTVTIGTVNRDILNSAPDARTNAGTTAPASGDASAKKPEDKLGSSNSTTNAGTATATPASPEGALESSIAVTAANANAKMAAAKIAAAKKAKQQKAVAPKRRPRPSDRKSTAPAPATTSSTPPTEAPAAKPAGSGGGGVPQL